MNRIIYILLAVLATTIIGNAQPLNLILNTAESGTQTHQARNSITFDAGYSYTPSGGTLTTSIINQLISGDINYASVINPSSYAINTNLSVGKTPGIFAANGSANYSIPLDIPNGRNGIQPSVSLNYVSSYTDGIIGIGWSIGGISAISRMNKTIYHDAKSDAIRGDLTDKYALDGNRLIVINGNYGAASSEYRTEIEQFSKIVAYGSTGTGPEWFKVYAKSGMIYEFGNTEDSKIRNDNNCVLSWKVNKITDRYNNYITFSYISSDDEHPIGEIEYTGNSSFSMEPFAKILFNYKSRTDVSNYCYGGNLFTKDILLDNIEIRNNDQTYKKYVLTYMQDVFAQLIKVTEYSRQNTALNPTVLAWTNQTEQFTQTSNYYSSTDELTYFGDFNGDGRDDLVTVPVKTSYTSSDKWKLYLANSSGNLVYTTQGDLNAYFETFLTGDFNGDGRDDLMMQENHSSSNYPNKKYYYFYQSTGTTFSRSTSYYICYNNEHLKIVDYNGDGKLEFFFHNTSNNWYLYTYSGTSIYSASIPSFGEYYYINTGLQNRIIDFNGDGCSDLLVLFADGYKVYEFKGTSNKLIETYSGTNIENNDFLLFGDYNGDGTTDIIKEGNSYTTDWSMLKLKDGGFQSFELDCFNDFNINILNNRIYARDMDGDGKTDAVLVGRGTNTSNSYNRINVALSTGNDFNITEYTSSTTMQNGNDRYFNFGDFNGDSRKQLFYKYYTTTPRLFSFAAGTPSHLISTIIDGMGAQTNISYLPMTNSTVYTKGTGASYPVIDYSTPAQLVSHVTMNNGIGGVSATTYQYAGAKVHREGKGFLGFSKISVTDGPSSIFSENNYTFDETFYYPQLTSSYVKRGSVTLSTTENSWNEISFGSKRIYPYITSSTATNNLTGFSTTTTTSTPDSYGNITNQSVAYSNGPTHSKTIAYSNDANNWLIARPGSTTTTMSQPGDANIVQLITTTYITGTASPDLVKYYDGNILKKQLNHDYNTNGTLSVFHEYSVGLGEKHTYYSYGADGINLTGKTMPDGTTETYTYYDATGQVHTATDYWGNVTTYNYDNFGNITNVTQPNGIGISSQTMAWVTSPTNARYSVTQTMTDGSQSVGYYDLLGREIRRGTKLFSGTMSYVQTDYNYKGQAYRVSEPFTSSASLWNTTSFDNYGRVSGTVPSVGASSSYSYSGGTTTVTNNGRTYTTVNSNATGWPASKSDPGGTIVYLYKADGSVKQITALGNVSTIMTYDTYGNQLSLNDPSAGNNSYTYYGGGEPKTQSTPLGTTTYHYHADGRLNYYTNPEGTYEYTYGTNKLVSSITSPGGVSRGYTYYSNGNVHEIFETIETGQTNKVTFVYDSFGRVGSKTYNDSYAESYVYNSNGHLDKILFDGIVVYDVSSMNIRGNITAASISGTSAIWGYNTYGQLTSSVATGVQGYSYSPNTTTGNMTSRTNSLKSLSETFYYDNLDRLGWVSSGSGSSLNIGYDSKGNLIYKSDAGTLVYDNGSPYQLAHVTPYSSNFPTEDQTIAYTSFGKISTISEGTNNAAFKYNSDKQRVKMAFTTNGPGFWTKYYFGGSYEKVVGAYTTTEYIWIGGDAYNAVAVAKIVDGGTPQVWGIFRDHLGSMTHVKNGSTIYEYSFDAWGRRRDKDNWSYTLSGAPALFANRGFTGHEHLTEFGLINMNGRLYDPLVGRFLSPDNYVQASGFTQSFNRYSYALNNPLTYVDPDGEFVLLAIGIGAAISGTIGYFGGKAAGLTGSDLAFYTMANAFIGGISGGIGASVGAGVSASLSFGGFAGGFVAGAAGGAAGGFVAGTYSTGLNNTMFGTNDNILLGGLKGAGIGALAGGIIGGTVAGIDAVRSDASFWNGRISESGGYNGPGRFLDEEITAGAKPTETGEISTLPSNDDYGKYGMTRSYSNGDAKPHFGVDYGGKVGDNVNAMYDGQVTRVGLGKAYGPNAVRTQSVINGRTYNVDYGHLSKSLVLAGDKVTSGTSVIGYMGRAGIPSYAPTHVHIAVWRPLPNGLMGFVMPHF